jgi:type IV fimbrial biogenesis protein FimT
MGKAESGMTLLEVIIVMTIAGIMAAIAIPSFVTTIRNNRLTTYTNDLVTGLMLARAEAVKRNVPVLTPVIMCRSSNTTVAAPTCAGAGTGGWEIGWFISTGGTVLMRRGAYTGSNFTMIGTANVANTINYNSDGLLGTFGSITVTDGRPAPNGVRIICIATTGRARVAPAGAVNCTNV